MTTFYTDIESPIGTVRVAWSDAGLRAIRVGTELEMPPTDDWRCDPHLRCDATEQLREYFAGSRREFDVDVVLTGTPFQEKVWRTLAGIPFGTTLSYAELAVRIGSPKAVRAVGAANGRNPIPIVLPCHRVIGSGGELRGYAGGVDIKEKLLLHEGVLLHKSGLF